MKYTKKMKLVEFKDGAQQPQIPNYIYNNDTTYAQPKVLLNLDKSMSDILFSQNLSDNDKCSLYNQTLQRYLHFVKQNNGSNSKNQNVDLVPEPEIFNSKVLSSPVRSFFESARNSNAHDQFNPFKITPPQPIPFQSPPQPKKKRSTKVKHASETPSISRPRRTARKLACRSKNSQIPRQITTRRTSTRNILTKPCSVVLEKWVPNTME